MKPTFIYNCFWVRIRNIMKQRIFRLYIHRPNISFFFIGHYIISFIYHYIFYTIIFFRILSFSIFSNIFLCHILLLIIFYKKLYHLCIIDSYQTSGCVTCDFIYDFYYLEHILCYLIYW